MTRKLIDTHFHLDHYRFHHEIYDTINHLQQFTLCVTNSPGIYVSCKRLYHETKYIKFALGFHPQNTDLSKQDFSDFMQLFNQVKYIGEIGLDFSSDRYMPPKEQIECFSEIVRVCAQDNKIMTTHIRRGENEAIEIIRRYHPRKCIIHWFSGSSTQLDSLIGLGCYFSINSNMVNNAKKRAMLTKIPDNRLLVESDGPFSKVSGQKYSPELLLESYKEIATFFKNPDFINCIYTNFLSLLTEGNP